MGLGCFLVCDYLWRQEKHINGESYILLVGIGGLFLGYLFLFLAVGWYVYGNSLVFFS